MLLVCLIGLVASWPSSVFAGLAEDFVDAARTGNSDKVLMLLSNGVDVNVKVGGVKDTALITAAAYGNINVVHVLLSKGADVNAGDINGTTPLTMASQNGHLEIVQLLLDKGADVNSKNIYGMTALTEASRMGYTQVVSLLVEKGAKLPSEPHVKEAKTVYLDRYLADVENSLQRKGYYHGKIGVLSDDFVHAYDKFKRDNKILGTDRLPDPVTDKALGIDYVPDDSCFWLITGGEKRLKCPEGCKAAMVMSSSVASGGMPTVSGYKVSCPGREEEIISLPSSNCADKCTLQYNRGELKAGITIEDCIKATCK
jgi:hypothetical protein